MEKQRLENIIEKIGTAYVNTVNYGLIGIGTYTLYDGIHNIYRGFNEHNENYFMMSLMEIGFSAYIASTLMLERNKCKVISRLASKKS